MKKICVLISGNGSNLQAILDATHPQQALAGISVERVISNRSNAYGLVRAQQAGVAIRVLSWNKAQDTREEYDRKLVLSVLESAPDLIVLAGFLHIVSAPFLTAVATYNRARSDDCPVINLHPALPDSYIGLGAIERAFHDYQQALQAASAIPAHGVMVHEVALEVDRGRVITTQTINPSRDDTLASFSEKMHAAERSALIKAIQSTLLNPS